MTQREKRKSYKVKIIVDLSKIKEDPELKPEIPRFEELFGKKPIKVAAVISGKILNSLEINPQEYKNISSIPIEIGFDYEPERFKGVNIIVAPNLSEKEFLGINSEKRWISVRRFRNDVADLSKEKLIISSSLFKIWLAFCQTYTIRGRVVCRKFKGFDLIEQKPIFCDEPVPGAKVEAYDVDCWWFWWKKEFIKSAITDINGFFEIKFRWCCFPWYPRLKHKWIINPELLEKVKEVFAAAKPPIPPPPPEALRSPVAFVEYTKQINTTSLGPQPEPPDIANVNPQPEPGFKEESIARRFRLPEMAYKIIPCWPFRRRDCRPDIIFKVSQECKGELEVIYEESLSQTRWNIPPHLNVTLLADCDKACSIPICEESPPEDCIQFTQVGCLVQVPEICNDPASPIFGYYNGSTNIPCTSPNRVDRPFGGTLDIYGFGFVGAENADYDYYKVQYAPYGTTSYADIKTRPFVRYFWFDPLPLTPPYTVRAVFEPISFGGEDDLIETVELWKKQWEASHPGQKLFPIPTNRDQIVRWATYNLPDGVYTIKLQGYKKTDGGLKGPYTVYSCVATNKEEKIHLYLDNRQDGHPASTPEHPCGSGTIHACTNEPDCDFIKIVKNDGTSESEEIGVCGIAKLKDTDTLTIYYEVKDEDGHLSHYCLSAHYAENEVFNIVNYCYSALQKGSAPIPLFPATYPGPRYTQALLQGATRPHWYGGSFKVTLTGADFISCAYLFRIRVWKRTTNGCGLVYGNRCEFSFCVEKI